MSDGPSQHSYRRKEGLLIARGELASFKTFGVVGELSDSVKELVWPAWLGRCLSV